MLKRYFPNPVMASRLLSCRSDPMTLSPPQVVDDFMADPARPWHYAMPGSRPAPRKGGALWRQSCPFCCFKCVAVWARRAVLAVGPSGR